MNSETKQCNNCGKEFTIEPEDFAFYEKIKVPPPTWCPECRLIRRMNFRNERVLYKRKCDATGKDIISIYSSDKPFKVYDQQYWWSDKWDPIGYGGEYDWNKPFFEQLRQLILITPLISVFNTEAVNTIYANHAKGNKNCYLVFGAFRNENVMYATRPAYAKDSLELYIVRETELCYENLYCFNCYKVFFGNNCRNCQESFFLYDCRNCSNCFGCTGLRNKQYYIFNQPHSKEEYSKKIKEFDIGNYQNLEKIKKEFKKFILKYPRRCAFLNRTIKTVGDQVQDAKNCYYCFDLVEGPIEDCKFLEWGGFGLKDSYDCIGNGAAAEMHYELIDGVGGSKDYFSIVNYNNSQTFYTINCHSSSNLFGCVGLRNKEYCILNKQYTKSEYEALVPKIIRHMNEMPYADKKGRVYKHGEFFPPELSPFCYNETIAQEYFPLTKEQALDQGYSWKDPEERNLKLDFKPQDLPDHIKDVKDDIVGKVIECSNAKSSQGMDPGKTYRGLTSGEFSNCTTAFKIISQELAFYRKMNLPLPRLCPNCRHYQRLKQRNPLKLWHRRCMCNGKTSAIARGETSGNYPQGLLTSDVKQQAYVNTTEHFHKDKPCPQEFETTYALDRPEIVYCEECYKREVN